MEPGNQPNVTGGPSADIPIVAITVRALTLPFKHLPQMVKLGGVSLLLAIAAQLLENVLLKTGVARVAPFWHWLIIVLVYVPFEVGWTRLVIDGAPAVATRSWFPIGRTEGLYLLTFVLFVLAWGIVAGPLWLFTYARRELDPILTIEAAVLLFAIVVALAIGLVRLLFIFPAVATGKYRGISAAWRESKCSFERLIALDALAHLPYLLALDLIARTRTPDEALVTRGLIAIVQCAVSLFANATGVAAIALAWRHVTTDQNTARGGHRSEIRAPA